MCSTAAQIKAAPIKCFLVVRSVKEKVTVGPLNQNRTREKKLLFSTGGQNEKEMNVFSSLFSSRAMRQHCSSITTQTCHFLGVCCCFKTMGFVCLSRNVANGCWQQAQIHGLSHSLSPRLYRTHSRLAHVLCLIQFSTASDSELQVNYREKRTKMIIG